jgi:histidinol phosphatase-like enzyme
MDFFPSHQRLLFGRLARSQLSQQEFSQVHECHDISLFMKKNTSDKVVFCPTVLSRAPMRAHKLARVELSCKTNTGTCVHFEFINQ